MLGSGVAWRWCQLAPYTREALAKQRGCSQVLPVSNARVHPTWRARHAAEACWVCAKPLRGHTVGQCGGEPRAQRSVQCGRVLVAAPPALAAIPTALGPCASPFTRHIQRPQLADTARSRKIGSCVDCVLRDNTRSRACPAARRPTHASRTPRGLLRHGYHAGRALRRHGWRWCVPSSTPSPHLCQLRRTGAARQARAPRPGFVHAGLWQAVSAPTA